jgi:glycosyltransferase involved in cell wall biosynthesis
MGSPAVSVVIPVHNRARFIADAVGSVLRQTYDDLEVIVVDDGSTDGTVQVVEALADRRIRIVAHDGNRGIPAARNTGLEAARGRFIAWLDSDDIARPNRLAVQVAFLEAHPEAAMVGSCAGTIAADGSRLRTVRVPPMRPADVQAWLLFRSPFQQSSVTGRAEVLRTFPYRPENPVCEDLDVFLRLARDHRIQNLPQVLCDRRLHGGQVIRSQKEAIRARKAALLSGLLGEVGLTPGEDDLARHVCLGKEGLDGRPPGDDFLGWADGWLQALRAANARSRRIDPAGLALATSFFWLKACRAEARRLGLGPALKALLGSPLARGGLTRHARGWAGQAVHILLGSSLERLVPRPLARSGAVAVAGSRPSLPNDHLPVT